MKKLLFAFALLLAFVPCANAEQCKQCNFSTGDLMAFFALLVLICLAFAFIVAVVVFFAFNSIQPAKRKNVGLTFCGAIFGGILGLVARLGPLWHSSWAYIIIYAFFCLLIGSSIGYLISPKKKPVSE